MTSRFFHALVVAGAAISAAACGGRSESTSGDDDAGNGAGGSGGTAAGGSGGVGTGGSVGGTDAFPEPSPTAQWDCSGASRGEPSDPVGPVHQGCVDVFGVTAERLLQDCPVDPTFPKSAADCTSTELFTCNLAVTVGGDPVLVNCTCEDQSRFGCQVCFALDRRNGPPVSCTPELKICECAYTGILR